MISGETIVVAFVHELLSVEQKVVGSIGLESLATLLLMYVLASWQPATASPVPRFRAAARAARSAARCPIRDVARAWPRSTRSAAKPIITTRISVRKTATAPR